MEIRFIGARPGKLHEELFAEGETWRPTTHQKILALDVRPVDRDWLDGELDALERLVDRGDALQLVSRLREIVLRPRAAARSVASSRSQQRLRDGTETRSVRSDPWTWPYRPPMSRSVR